MRKEPVCNHANVSRDIGSGCTLDGAAVALVRGRAHYDSDSHQDSGVEAFGHQQLFNPICDRRDLKKPTAQDATYARIQCEGGGCMVSGAGFARINCLFVCIDVTSSEC